jgi:hypothetical protein
LQEVEWLQTIPVGANLLGAHLDGGFEGGVILAPDGEAPVAHDERADLYLLEPALRVDPIVQRLCFLRWLRQTGRLAP